MSVAMMGCVNVKGSRKKRWVSKVLEGQQRSRRSIAKMAVVSKHSGTFRRIIHGHSHACILEPRQRADRQLTKSSNRQERERRAAVLVLG
jgi:hypothetical protein